MFFRVPSAFTDINQNDTAHTHGLYVGLGSNVDTTVIYKAGSSADGPSLERLSPSWFEEKGTAYTDLAKPLQWEFGERERMPSVEDPNADCMFWAHKKVSYEDRHIRPALM